MLERDTEVEVHTWCRPLSYRWFNASFHRLIFVASSVVILTLVSLLLEATVYARAVGATAQATLTASDAESGDRFGTSAAVSGDAVLVGAPLVGGVGTESGSAYVYELIGGLRTETILIPLDSVAEMRFGFDVALDGDLAVVGAYRDSAVADRSGSAYIFERTAPGVWAEIAKLTASDGAANDKFGFEVAVAGSRVAVGAYGRDVNGNSSGAVYLFEPDAGGTWTETAILEATDAAAGDRLGISLAMDGDRIAAGAYRDDSVGPNTGAVYVFEPGPAGWIQTKLVDPTTPAEANLGWSVDIDDTTVVAGTRLDDGMVSVFVLEGGGAFTVSQPVATSSSTSERLGWSVSVEGSTVIAGSPSAADVGVNGGAVTALTSTPSGQVEKRVLVGPPLAGNQYGWKVDVDQSSLVIAAPRANGNSGTVYLVDLGSVAPSAFWDGDSDTFGRSGVELIHQGLLPGWSDVATDCDDADPLIFPGATEVPGDGVDQDCDGVDAPVDVDAPVVTVVLPAVEGESVVVPGVLDGVVTDAGGSGIGLVSAALQDVGSGDWVDLSGGVLVGREEFEVVRSNELVGGLDWSLAVDLPPGEYRVFVNAVDVVGNAAAAVSRAFVVDAPVDVDAPVVTVVLPAVEGESVVVPGVLDGVVTDAGGSGIGLVSAALQDVGSGDWVDLSGGVLVGREEFEVVRSNELVGGLDWSLAVDLPPGEYRVFVNAVDVVGNAAAEVSRAFVVDAPVDVDAPVAVFGNVSDGVLVPGQFDLGGMVSDVGGSGISVVEVLIRNLDLGVWNDASGNPGYVRIPATLSNQSVGSADWVLPIDLPDGRYRLSVRGVDGSGNRGNFVRVVVDVGGAPVDVDAPVAVFGNVSDGVLVPGQFDLGGMVSDVGGSGISVVEVLIRNLDLGVWNDASGNPGYVRIPATLSNQSVGSADWVLPIDLPDGRYRLSVRGVDGSGNRGNFVRVVVDVGGAPVDVDAPVVTVVLPAVEGESVVVPGVLDGVVTDAGGSGIGLVSAALQDVGSGDWVDLSGGVLVGREEFEVVRSNELVGGLDWSLAVDLPPGEYRVFVNAVDVVGNAAAEVSRAFVVDVDAPVAVFGNVSDGVLVPGQFDLGGMVSDVGGSGISVVEVLIRNLDLGVWNDASGNPGYVRIPATLSNQSVGSADWVLPIDLPDGRYRLSVRGVDGSGNRGNFVRVVVDVGDA